MEAVGEQGELSLDRTRLINEVLTGYTYFREGDVSIAKITPCFENGKGAIMRNLVGGVGFGTTELIVARPRQDRTTPEFLDWLFRSPTFRTRGEAAMYGAGGQKRVPDDFVRDFISPGPPLAEQVAIAAFLDRETAKIDALIEEQRRLIALLKEKRQAVISHAVTKGLDPHAPMKDSGIEWLGDVPAHWEVGPLKRHWSVTDCKHITAEFVDDGIPLASIREVQSRFVDLAVAKRTTDEFFDQLIEGGRKPESGDLIFSRNATVGEVAQVAEWHPPFAMGQDVCLLKRRQADSCPDYMQLVLRSLVGETQLANLLIGSTFKRVNVEDIRNLILPFPPPQEQQEIAAWLLCLANQYGDLSEQAERGIALLKERRAALISAAVTGKIDVHGSAKVLPFPIDRARARALVGTEIIERSAGQATFGRVKFQKMAFLAEGHVAISELAGCYTRAAAGPLDGALIEDMERGAHSIAGIAVDQAGGTGTTVSYRLGQQRGAHRQELADWLGPDRTAKLDKLVADFAPLNTKQAEAVATLYGVWNDLLNEGASPSDDEIISGFLNDWHPEKREKFRASELPEWLGWMRRHGIVPTASGPKTTTGRLFV
jgi:type I restriction enzyme S subunit